MKVLLKFPVLFEKVPTVGGNKQTQQQKGYFHFGQVIYYLLLSLQRARNIKYRTNDIYMIEYLKNTVDVRIIKMQQCVRIKIIRQFIMQINIKLKFDSKRNKPISLWEKNKKPFFLENTEFQHKEKIVQPELHSFQQFEESKEPEREPIRTHRQFSKDIQVKQKRKPSSSKKQSKSKGVKQHCQTPHKKNNIMKRNVSDVTKKPIKKPSIVNSSNFLDELTFRGSLPGLSGKNVLKTFAPVLSENQKIELINQKTVYYIGVGAGPGQDDLEGSYLWRKHQQVGYRYQLLECLGSGAFGEVVKAFDHKNKETVAIKIIKSKKQHMQLALNQINILMRAKEKDIDNQKNIVRIKDFIVFRKHICIVTELLSISLYDLMQLNQFQSLQMPHIRTFAIQILNALVFLKQNSIIHSDIKPENVLLKNKSRTGIKLIDFGTSMFEHEVSFMYIQSRFYRAPEVILGAPYGYPIDMWSFGCLIAELYLGEPLLAGRNQQEQLSLIMQMIGQPPKDYLTVCKHANQYFKEESSPKIIKSKDGKAIIPGSKPLSIQIQDKFLAEFLAKIFVYRPSQRLQPLDALLDPWIVDGLPQQIRQQHLSYVRLKFKKAQETAEEKKTLAKNTAKKHIKRNSDFVGGEKPKPGHNRRRSDGFN